MIVYNEKMFKQFFENFLSNYWLNTYGSNMYQRPGKNNQLMRQVEELVSASSNRYRITVQVANRAKRRRAEDFDSIEEPTMKPVIQAVVEMWDELNQPEIIAD